MQTLRTLLSRMVISDFAASANVQERQLLWAGYDIRTVQELMGHKSIKTTMVYLHLLYPGSWKGVESPLDNMPVEHLINQ